jgi:hypothetical protein
MRELRGFTVAVDAEPVALVLDAPPPDFDGDGWLARARSHYAERAVEFVDALHKHAAGGFFDAVFGEMAHRKASVFRVSHYDSVNKAR